MCFSATASFISSGILGTVGVASIKSAQEPKQKKFAAIPLLFSIQQLIEGFLWLTLSSETTTTMLHALILSFLIFALLIWPVWTGISVIPIEKKLMRKRIQYAFFGCGLLFAFYSLFYLLKYSVSAKIDGYHILYIVDFPNKDNPLTGIIYFAATVGPLLVSSVKKVPLLGILIFASYVITKLIYDDYVISVWCFFAAAVSVVIYLMVTDRIKSLNKVNA